MYYVFIVLLEHPSTSQLIYQNRFYNVEHLSHSRGYHSCCRLLCTATKVLDNEISKWYESIKFFILINSKQNILLKGVSARTQVLFAITYTLRYLDLAFYFSSWYNIGMKIFFISTSYCIVFTIYVILKKTYQREHDTFRLV